MFALLEVNMISGINGVLISSHNPRQLIEFYKKIGFELRAADHGDGLHAEGDFGDVHFAIWDAGSKVRSFIWGNENQAPSSNITFSLHVPSLEETYNALVAKGVFFETSPTALPFGGVLAILKDPDGNRIIMMRWQ